MALAGPVHGVHDEPQLSTSESSTHAPLQACVPVVQAKLQA